MSLSYFAVVPHPPLIIPEIAGENHALVKKTFEAMKVIAKHFSQSEVDTLLCISPHAKLASFAMTVCYPESYHGDFSGFGHSEIAIISDSDKEIASGLIFEAKKRGISLNIEYSGLLDHGAMVPLYFLKKFTDYHFKFVEIGYSGLSVADHLKFGELIGDVIKKTKTRVALIASGDLAHRHFDNQYKKYSKKFDDLVMDTISSGSLDRIASFPPDLVEFAGECGYRSLLIASGAIKEKKNKIKLISYENPFGVGYLVAEWR